MAKKNGLLSWDTTPSAASASRKQMGGIFNQLPLQTPQQLSLINQFGEIGQQGLLSQLPASLGGNKQMPTRGQSAIDSIAQSLSGSEGGSLWPTLFKIGGTAAGTYFAGPAGGAVGGWAGGQLGSWVESKGAKNDNSSYNPGDFLSALQQLGGSAPQQNLDFGPIRDKYTRDFERGGLNQLLERFTSAGHGIRGSGALRRELGSARAGLDTDLAALEQGENRQNFQVNEQARHNQILAAMNLLQGNRNYGTAQQQLSQGKTRLTQNQQELNQRNQQQQFANQFNTQQQQQNLYQSLLGAQLQPQNQNLFVGDQPSQWGQIGAAALGALGTFGGAYFGGPGAAAAGGQAAAAAGRSNLFHKG